MFSIVVLEIACTLRQVTVTSISILLHKLSRHDLPGSISVMNIPEHDLFCQGFPGQCNAQHGCACAQACIEAQLRSFQTVLSVSLWNGMIRWAALELTYFTCQHLACCM